MYRVSVQSPPSPPPKATKRSRRPEPVVLTFWADVSAMSESAGGRSFTAPRQNVTSPPDTADDATRYYIQRIASGHGKKIDDGEGARTQR
ncbi:hypothetical protein WME90_33215 [Sorangium sp. So ce375]|uniref:hypothetical protein n=1 Tax=Sorangium sp. So ce375 TaxID=3133306 RepID=UPI003F5B9950